MLRSCSHRGCCCTLPFVSASSGLITLYIRLLQVDGILTCLITSINVIGLLYFLALDLFIDAVQGDVVCVIVVRMLSDEVIVLWLSR